MEGTASGAQNGLASGAKLGSLVERAENFDALMGDVSAYIESGEDPFLARDDNHINDPAEREMRRFYDRLRQRGKPGNVSVVEVMRKILLQLNAVSRRSTPWVRQAA